VIQDIHLVRIRNGLLGKQLGDVGKRLDFKRVPPHQIMNGESEAKGAKCGHVAFQRQKVNLRPFYYRIELKA
jgi:hypothetical protein